MRKCDATIARNAKTTARPPSRGAEDFIAAIRAAPADDRPRLAYADWLLTLGQGGPPAVTVSCALRQDFTCALRAETLRMTGTAPPMVRSLNHEMAARL